MSDKKVLDFAYIWYIIALYIGEGDFYGYRKRIT